MNTENRQYGALIGFVLVTAAAAVCGSQFEPGAWHAALTKPSWNPPNWVFAPVWTTLYVLIAIAGWLVWRARPARWANTATVAWFVQMALNAMWSWLFFGLHQPLWSLIIIVAMVIAIASFIVVAWPHRRLAAWLFVPYLLWVSFATALNAAIWWLNR